MAALGKEKGFLGKEKGFVEKLFYKPYGDKNSNFIPRTLNGLVH